MQRGKNAFYWMFQKDHTFVSDGHRVYRLSKGMLVTKFLQYGFESSSNGKLQNSHQYTP